ncbi:hypothetical protein G7046_g8569 [Stylonectria norvegica]|nr:hypothetical protein G7046_g8569 [Stylonectria norvegica]
MIDDMARGKTLASSGGYTGSFVGYRILFVDAFDSFTNNIVSLLKTLFFGVEVFILPIDKSLKDFGLDFTHFDAIVCGPGPGSPLEPTDVGFFSTVWQQKHLPVLGICLGFQSLVVTHGGKIRKLKQGLHGIVREIEHNQVASIEFAHDIFNGVPPFRATLYHSLGADIGQDDIPETTWTRGSKWNPTPEVPDLVPLAWVVEPRDDGTDERILMAVKHRRKPFWGIQYHPESICTDQAAQRVIYNWFQEALAWNDRYHNREDHKQKPWPKCANRTSKPGHLEMSYRRKFEYHEWRRQYNVDLPPPSLTDLHKTFEYKCRKIPLPQGVGLPEIATLLGLGEDECIMLDSSSSATGDLRARNTIIALGVKQALRFEFHLEDQYVTVKLPASSGLPARLETLPFKKGQTNIWQTISEFWGKRNYYYQNSPAASCSGPVFRGGFMGFVTYEMGLHDLDVFSPPVPRSHARPDVCMAWITKSLVLDHTAGVLYIQDLEAPDNDTSWIADLAEKFERSEEWISPPNKHDAVRPDKPQQPGKADDLNGNGADKKSHKAGDRLRRREPSPTMYEEQVRQCQEYIAQGHSYELCLTTQTTMTRPRDEESADRGNTHGRKNTTPWEMYQTLRKRQPAPFGSFIRLGGATLLSSSPERFLSYDPKGLCSMRPMKGTVRKSEAVSTLAQAEKILHIPKEEAENLMIVDLVRHDLHGVCGAGNVTVSELMKVEEYATVFQMITVVNGQLPLPKRIMREDPTWNEEAPRDPSTKTFQLTGLDALTAALPPGSMTGAPKKRSCELLQLIEHSQERSLYSGCVGFMDIAGNGDWSVTIRSMFRWDDEEAPAEEGETEPREVWHIGAGGAVTILSTPEGEREEMFTKLAGPLGVFRDVA